VDDHTRDPSNASQHRIGRYPPRNYLFLLLGIAGLVLVFRYAGPLFDLVHSYGGNLTASFASYFIVGPAVSRVRSSRAASAVIALLATQLFEATDGFFGLMANTYDPFDYLANAIGVALAVAVDFVATSASRSLRHRSATADGDRSRNAGPLS